MQNQVNMNPERTILSSTSPATASPQFIISSSGVVNLSDIVLTNSKANMGMSFITFLLKICLALNCLTDFMLCKKKYF